MVSLFTIYIGYAFNISRQRWKSEQDLSKHGKTKKQGLKGVAASYLIAHGWLE